MKQHIILLALSFGICLFSGCADEKMQQTNHATTKTNNVTPMPSENNHIKVEKSPTVEPTMKVASKEEMSNPATNIKSSELKADKGFDVNPQDEEDKKAMDLLIAKIGKINQGTALMFDGVKEMNGVQYHVIEHFENMNTHKANLAWYYVDVFNKKVYIMDIIMNELKPI